MDYLLSVGRMKEIAEGTFMWLLKGQKSQSSFQLAEDIIVRFSSLAELILSELQGLFDPAGANEFYEVQLLQMEVQVSVVVQQLGVQLVDQIGGFLNSTILYSVANANSVVQRIELHSRPDARLLLKLFGSLFETLCNQISALPIFFVLFFFVSTALTCY